MLQLWHKTAILYCLDVETFQDSSGDGIGDFKGLTSRVNYLSGLGITCIWLLPFYPTPNRDNGYDVKDYFNVDPRLGDLGDFVDFMRAADEHGIRVIIDLVVNHTSIEHPWFQKARSSADSPYRNYYLWNQEKPDDAHEDLIFPGFEPTKWTFDERAGAYYFHRFYSHQADLNIANPLVRDEIRRVMAFWLRLGVSGFRVDAAQYLIDFNAATDVEVQNPYKYLVEFRNYLSWYRGDAILLAEADVPMAEVQNYFGQGERLQMMFSFVMSQHIMLSLVQGHAVAVREAIRSLPEIPERCQWAMFLRNHDELAINRLTEQEQGEVYQAFAPDEGMRLYDRGIRRRLPPMLGGDLRRVKLAQCLLFALPGTPVLRYGEEIGMGDDLSLPERNSVRTPMQWNDSRSGGFSTASNEQLVRPVIDQGKFRYQEVNVASQERDPDSLFSLTERLIRIRKENMAFGWGAASVIETGNDQVLAHRCDWDGTTVIALHNLGPDACSIDIQIPADDEQLINELLADSSYGSINSLDQPLRIEGYGYRWFGLESNQRRTASTEIPTLSSDFSNAIKSRTASG